MRSLLSKKTIVFIASVMLMTVAFAVPVLADDENINVDIKYNGETVGNLQFRPNPNVTYEVDNRNNNNIPFTLTMSNVTGATISFLAGGSARIDIEGTFSGFNTTDWVQYADSAGYIQPLSSSGNPLSTTIEGMITSLEGTELPSSYIGRMLPFKLGVESIRICNINGDERTAVEISSVPFTGFSSLNYGPNSSKKNEEKKEENHEEEDEAPQPKKSEWRPAPEAAKTPAQTAAAQLTTAQTNLAALSAIPAASKAVFKSSGMPLNMTSVNTIDSNTTKLITANADIPYNVTFNFMGKPMICTIPAGFNYAQFTKADGTMNIHEVLWSVYTGSWKKANTRTRTTRGRR